MTITTSSRAAILAGALALFGGGAAEAAKCDWTVSGTLRVEYARLAEMAAREGGTAPLANVRVKVSARSKVLGVWGTWNKWEKTRGDGDGRFTVGKRKNCGDRQFKVEVKFEDDDLEIRHETATSSLTKVKWYEAVQDADNGRVRTSSTVNLGTLTFRPGGGAELGDFEARRHAELWGLYHLVFDHLAAKGPKFAFKSRVKIKYPHNSLLAPDAVEASYVNPTTEVMYIYRSRDGSEDHFTVETLLHELGHRWAFERFRGELCLTLDLITSGDTHDLADDPCVAFHEGFAKYFQQQLENELFGEAPDLPYNRARLDAGVGFPPTALTSIDLLQRFDEGWWTVLTSITLPAIHRYDYGTADRAVGTGRIAERTLVPRFCSPPSISFKNLLRVFEPKSSAGYPEYLDRGDTTLDGFLTRADAILGSMDADDRNLFMVLADPASSLQPADLLCGSPQPQRIERVVLPDRVRRSE